ncbi:MAG TPA: hypothetical protein VNQ53_00375 [Nocardioides sp.]|nr:hypothetical protein [Nocardioides sp.]
MNLATAIQLTVALAVATTGTALGVGTALVSFTVLGLRRWARLRHGLRVDGAKAALADIHESNALPLQHAR